MFQNNSLYDLIILGGGPAGVFAAITYKTQFINSSILIIESTSSLLSKILVSGGGRCNLTSATFDPKILAQNFPRGEKELLGPFNRFGPRDIMNFFEKRNIKLKVEKESRVFPISNKSQDIRDCLLLELSKLQIDILLNTTIKSAKKEKYFSLHDGEKNFFCKKLLLATSCSKKGLELAKEFGHKIKKPLPSLFAFKLKPSLKDLSGISLDASIKIKDSHFEQTGSLLITHTGLSGPLILKLSSLATKLIHEKPEITLQINWISMSENEAFSKLSNLKKASKKNLFLENIFKLPDRLWKKFLSPDLAKPLSNISSIQLSKLAKTLTQDQYILLGKTPSKNEFVTCGGITLNEVNFKTMESKICPHLHFAGEILDIDGLTGGYNLQNAWTTGFIAGSS